MTFGLVLGMAASLNLTSDSLGSATTTVAACQAGALNATYTSTYSATSPGYTVGTVTITGLAGTCYSKPYKVTLSGAAGASLGEATGTTPGAGTTHCRDLRTGGQRGIDHRHQRRHQRLALTVGLASGGADPPALCWSQTDEPIATGDGSCAPDRDRPGHRRRGLAELCHRHAGRGHHGDAHAARPRALASCRTFPQATVISVTVDALPAACGTGRER